MNIEIDPLIHNQMVMDKHLGLTGSTFVN
ncbi:hypothetical protein C206_13214 [Pseudomonas putida TRO1]|nr:hypothetical protein C206_13214 [Pseudomonas putida TRO1]